MRDSKSLIRAAIIAALYVILIWLLAPVSFGPIQFRVAEALTLLPMLYPEAIPGLYIGVLLGNLLGGLGLWDIFGGSLVTLLAAYVTWRYRRKPIIAYLSPVVFNAFLISIYLHYIYTLPYWYMVFSIGASEAVVVFLLGVPLVKLLKNMGVRD
ncbi:MAG: QueT transporter family protein [Firmicutes bacterium]|nr:QueT transporter family protein [Bacillota bacterium]